MFVYIVGTNRQRKEVRHDDFASFRENDLGICRFSWVKVIYVVVAPVYANEVQQNCF